jgi:hypothetical protein
MSGLSRDDVMKMAREACGEPTWDGGVEWVWAELERFAALVAAAEREACAKLVDEMQNTTRKGVIKAIRARGQG